jgi:hypothetical protein
MACQRGRPQLSSRLQDPTAGNGDRSRRNNKNSNMNPKRLAAVLSGMILSVMSGFPNPGPAQAAAASSAAPPVRVTTKALVANGVKAAPQQSKPITVTTASLTARGVATAAPSKPIQVKTATLVANGKRNR